MEQLQRPDFKAFAELGWFVYVYLRTKDWSPYYVGISSDAYRPIGKHTCVVPKDWARITGDRADRLPASSVASATGERSVNRE